MYSDLSGSPIVPVLVACAPGLFYWWSGRALARAIDDPVLPERLFALQRRSGIIFFLAIAVLIVTAFASILWSVLLLVLARQAAAYPLRRRLYDETWSLLTFLSFTLRAIIALPGFWLAVLLIPIVAEFAGPFDWLASVAMGSVLLTWNARYPHVIRGIFDAKPVQDERLTPRFVAMASVCGLETTRFEYVDLRGGAILNAIALPSMKESAVVFTDTMLRRLEPDETVAICAHELAHLEYYHADRLRRIGLSTAALIGLGVAVAPAARLMGFSMIVTQAFWALIVLAFMVVLARHRQRNETDSDRRAVTLCGDPEALVRALTKAYAFNRFPRRLDGEFERHASHPSLARRVRDIRATANRPPAEFTGSLAVICADGSTLTLDETRVSWMDPDGTTHGVPYDQLAELRFDIKHHRRTPRLLIVQRSGRKWHLEIDPADVARVQEILDLVDGRLAEPVAADQWAGASRVLASMGALISVTAGMLALGLVTILAAYKPSPRILAAAGFGALTGALVTLRDRPFSGELLVIICVSLTAFGIGWIYQASTTDTPPPNRGEMLSFAAVGVVAAMAALTMFANGTDALGLYQSATSMPGGAALLAAFSGALAFTPGKWRRPAASLVGILAAAALSIGTSPFLDRFGRDPFLVQSSRFDRQFVTGQPATEFTVPFSVSELRISPQGGHIALASYDASSQDYDGMTFHLGQPGSHLSRISADDVVFLDEDHVVLMRSRMGRVEIEVRAVEAPDQVVWETQLRDIYATHLVVATGTRRWMIAGTADEQQLVRFEGEVGTADARETRWTVGRSGVFPTAVVGSGKEVLVVETDYDFGWSGDEVLSPIWWLRLLRGVSPGLRWWRTGSDAGVGASRLEANCFHVGAPSDQLLCAAFDGNRTRFAFLDATGKLTPVGWVPGRFMAFGRGAGTGPGAADWVAGFTGSTATLVNASTRQTLEFSTEHDGGRVRSIAASTALVGGVWLEGSSSTIRLFKRSSPLVAGR